MPILPIPRTLPACWPWRRDCFLLAPVEALLSMYQHGYYFSIGLLSEIVSVLLQNPVQDSPSHDIPWNITLIICPISVYIFPSDMDIYGLHDFTVSLFPNCYTKSAVFPCFSLELIFLPNTKRRSRLLIKTIKETI